MVGTTSLPNVIIYNFFYDIVKLIPIKKINVKVTF